MSRSEKGASERSSGRKRRAESDAAPGDAELSCDGGCTLSRLEQIIREHARQDCLKSVPSESRIETKTLLDAIPFFKLLSSIRCDAGTTQVPLVSRVYEEKFMRQCIGSGEAPCLMGNQCECMMIDPANAFVGVEFVIPNDEAVSNGMCVLCLRKITTLLFYRTIQRGLNVSCLIQRCGNICNQPGEYHPSAMLICPPSGPVASMPLPIVAHQRNRYSVVRMQGVCYLKQRRVGMEDF